MCDDPHDSLRSYSEQFPILNRLSDPILDCSLAFQANDDEKLLLLKPKPRLAVKELKIFILLSLSNLCMTESIEMGLKSYQRL